jgi:ATP phosphoribosyltransferase regulatory subunit
LTQRREAHGHLVGAGRSPEEIAERFLDRRAIPDAAVARRATETLNDYLAIAAPLGEAADALKDFARRRGVEFGAALATFEAWAAAIAALVPDAPVRFEAGFGRPLDYYTGLVFEIRAAGIDAPLAGGGRYDRMMEMLGADRPIPAVGFTMRLDLAAGGGGV